MVVEQIDIVGPPALEAEGDPPVARHRDTPQTGQISFERVQSSARIDREIARFRNPVEDRQDPPDLVGALRRNAAAIIPLPQPSQALVPEAVDCHAFMESVK
jgi:hypothetical protein